MRPTGSRPKSRRNCCRRIPKTGCWRAARVSAFRPEMIRDQALAVSGLLVEKVGGPSVKPYQPPGLWQELAGGKGYVQDHGDGLVSPQPVHVLEAHRGAAIHDQFRFAQPRDLHGARNPHQYAAAGARSDERRRVYWRLRASWPSECCWRAAATAAAAHRVRLSAGPGATREPAEQAGCADTLQHFETRYRADPRSREEVPVAKASRRAMAKLNAARTGRLHEPWPA